MTGHSPKPDNASESQALAGMVILFLVAAVLFSINIWGYPLWPPHEPHVAQVAREMLLSRDFIRPTVNGLDARETAPLLPWAVALISLVPGDVTEWSGRIPVVASALATLFFTYLLALRLFGRRTALWSVIVLATGFRFWWQARSLEPEMVLCAAMAMGLYALWRWDESRRWPWLLLIYGAVALGLLAGGLSALLFPLLFIFFFYRGAPASRKSLHWVLGHGIALAMAALWYIPARLAAAEWRLPDFRALIYEDLILQPASHLVLGAGRAQPPWYYVVSLLMDWFPWTLFLPWVLVYVWQHRAANRMMWFLFCWTMPALLFFSLAIGKSATYILPLFPAMAIFIAASLVYFDETAALKWRSRIAYLWAGLLAMLGAGLVAAPWIQLPERGEAVDITNPIAISTMGILVLGLGAYTLFKGRRGSTGLIHRIVAGQMALILFMCALALLPEINKSKTAKGFTAPIRMLADGGDHFALYSMGFSRPEFVFYSRTLHEPILTSQVGADETSSALPRASLREQAKTRAALMAAVEEVPVQNLESITERERRALRAAIDAALGPENAADTYGGVGARVIEELDQFSKRFVEETPAYLFVQLNDFRWIYPLFTTPPAFYVLRHDSVGRRQVLLLANPAGRALYDKRISGTGMLSQDSGALRNEAV